MRVAGIHIQKTATGKIKSVTFDYKKHGEAIAPVLEQLGAIEPDEFEKEWAKGGLTPEEFRQAMHEHIKTLPWQK